MPLPPQGMSAKEKRLYMAKVFEVTQNAMSQTVDDVGLERRRAVPFPSTWKGKSIAEHGPIPTDAHLIPSNLVIVKPELSSFKEDASGAGKPLGLSGKPWYAYRKPEPPIFQGSAAGDAGAGEAASSSAPKVPFNEEMYRTQHMEWTLQKNAYNPDIAAAMRTNVRKQASLSTVDPSTLTQDPARSSENVKAALTYSEHVSGPSTMPKVKLGLSNVYPQAAP
jgi:hypothetical protein